MDDAGGAYPFSTGQPNYREFFYSTVGLSGESQGFDGNGPFVRFQAGGGPKLVHMARARVHAIRCQQSVWALNISDPLGTRPRLPTQGKPPVPHGRPLLHADGPRPQRPAGAIGPASPKAP